MRALLIALTLHIASNITGNIAADSGPMTPTLLNGYVAYPDIGVAYKFVSENVTWIEARNLCVNEGAQLALIDSFDKINHLKRNFSIEHVSWVHVGIHRIDNKWVSVRDGDVVESIQWHPSYPSGNGNCVVVSLVTAVLYNEECTNDKDTLDFADIEYYVCELPIWTS